MKRIPNQTVSDLIRLIPVLIEGIPAGGSIKVINAIRLLKIIVKRLKKLKDEQN